MADGDRITHRRVRPGVPRGQPLDPRRAGRGRAYARRHDPAHRRLQGRPAAAGRPADRPAGLRPDRHRGGRPVDGRLHQRRDPGLRDPGAGHLPGAGAGLRRQPAAGDRGLLRLARAPGAAGARRRRGPRPQGRLRRPVDGPQHGRGPRPGLPAGAGQHLDRAARHREVPARGGGDHLHRVAGRAAVGAVPDGQPGAPGGHPHPRRHGGAGQLADPGQRERGLPGDQRAEPAGRARGAQGQRAGARLRPRRGRRAALLLQHRATPQRDAGAR